MCSFLHQLRKQVWWRRSFILGDLNGKFFQVGYRVEPKLNAQQGAICAAFFSKCSEQSTSCFLVPTSLRLDPIDSLALATVVFWLHFFFFGKAKAWKENSLSTFHCNQLQHTCSACFKTDLPDYFGFNFVQVVTEPCGSVILLWCHGGHMTESRIFSCRRHSCSKRCVCFHSNQHFYVPQENVNLSNEQRVC